jgi:hypothetical protein
MDNGLKDLNDEIANRTSLENTLHYKSVVWLATSAGVFEGKISARIKTDKEDIVELQSCIYLSAHGDKSIRSFKIKVDEIIGWGERP